MIPMYWSVRSDGQVLADHRDSKHYARVSIKSAQDFFDFSSGSFFSATPMPTEVTLLLKEVKTSSGGASREALDRLLPIVYNELRKLAGSFLNREHAVSMQTTELVHEAYFKLTNQRAVDWDNRGQFFAIAAQAMRRILTDAARTRSAAKRDAQKVSIDDAPSVSVDVDTRLLDLDDALKELAEFDPDQAKVVELRYFGGLTIEETAEVLRVSPATVKREWTTARAWLFDRINGK